MARTNRNAEKPAAPDIHRIVVEKNIIGESALALEQQFLREMGRATGPVLLDLTRVSLIDSRGIALCVGLLKECEKKGFAFSIDISPALGRFFRLLKLDRVFRLNERSDV